MFAIEKILGKQWSIRCIVSIFSYSTILNKLIMFIIDQSMGMALEGIFGILSYIFIMAGAAFHDVLSYHLTILMIKMKVKVFFKIVLDSIISLLLLSSTINIVLNSLVRQWEDPDINHTFYNILGDMYTHLNIGFLQ